MNRRFVFRLPALAFDIHDAEQICRHFGDVVSCIRDSSADLYNAIKDKQWHSLSPREQKKVFRYLVRGRYRATPFGKWASVGTGTWGAQSFLKERGISYRPLQVEEAEWICAMESVLDGNCAESVCQVNPTLKKEGGCWYYHSFDPGTGKWSEYFEHSSEELDRLIDSLRVIGRHDFETFCGVFPGEMEPMRLWAGLIKIGILAIVATKEPRRSNVLASKRAKWVGNSYFGGTCQQNKDILAQVDMLGSGIGGLFVNEGRPILDRFQFWFTKRYDDLFVPLSTLLVPGIGLSQVLDGIAADMGRESEANKKLVEILCGNRESVDLSKLVCREAIPGNVTFTVSYRELASGGILVDNLFCGRPHSLIGRFCDNPDIMSLIAEPERALPGDPPHEFAEVVILEEEGTQAICQAGRVYKRQIRLDAAAGAGEDIISLEDLWLGLDKGEWVLYCERSGKRIIPVFPHAVSYNWITHPVAKLLWEISNQGNPKFLLYQNPLLQEIPYLPRITWGEKVVLSPRRWNVGIEDIGMGEDLGRLLGQLGIPKMVVAGNSDREFALDLGHAQCRELLLDEIRRSGRLQVKEWLWSDSPYVLGEGVSVYPQFVVTIGAGNPAVPRQMAGLNRSRKRNEEWVGWRIYLPLGIMEAFVSKSLFGIISHESVRDNIGEWFYVFFEDSSPHIRLRVKTANDSERFGLMGSLYTLVRKSVPLARLEELDYFPETSKYGNSGVLESEGIFHLESCFFSRPLVGQVGFIGLPEAKRIGWMVGYWAKVLSGAGLGETYCSWFWVEWKSVPAGERKKTSSKWRALATEMREGGDICWDVAGLSMKMGAHPGLGEEESLRVALHHIHMMANRLFLDRGNAVEGLVRFGIHSECRAGKVNRMSCT